MTTAREVDRVFVMADLSGFTALTEAHGSRTAAETVTRYVEIVRASLGSGVKLHERAGDAVVLVADDATAAVRTAVRLRDAVEREPLFPMVRVGLDGGPVVEQDGAYFGTPLNVTARVTAHARAGQVLCTGRVASAAHDLDGVEFKSLGPVRFKNVADPVVVVEVIARSALGAGAVVDPVCRMRVDPETAPARLVHEGAPRYFCSLPCARTFLAVPDGYPL